MRGRGLVFFICALLFAFLPHSRAAEKSGSTDQVSHQELSAKYESPLDQDLTIRRIAVLPATDNVDGIYSRPIEAQLIQLAQDSHHWDFAQSHLELSPSYSLLDLEERPAKFKKLVAGIDADAFLVASASRGPGGLSIRVDLFLKKDGKLLAQEILRDHPRTELSEVKDRVADLYRKVIGRIPYQGLVLSREQNRVTVDLGKKDGMNRDQIITVVQILNLNRHPKFGFIISTEKEILGRIKILKVEDTLSFGSIISEKERGAIQKWAKISGLEEVNYGLPDSIKDGSSPADLSSRPDSPVSFGKNPREWLPVRPPAFGAVGLAVGLGHYDTSVNTSSGTYEASSWIYPSVDLEGEIWLTKNWFAEANIFQGITSTSNPRAGSAPGTLQQSASRYTLDFGYNFLLRDDFFGPKISLSLGYSTYQMYVDSSTPTALTTVTYSGPVVGVSCLFPVSDDKVWFAGGRVNLMEFTGFSEAPVSSGGSPQSQVIDFSVNVQKKIAENIRLIGALDFSLYSTSFSGAGSRVGADGVTPETASTLSQRHSILSVGIEYMF